MTEEELEKAELQYIAAEEALQILIAAKLGDQEFAQKLEEFSTGLLCAIREHHDGSWEPIWDLDGEVMRFCYNLGLPWHKDKCANCGTTIQQPTKSCPLCRTEIRWAG